MRLRKRQETGYQASCITCLLILIQDVGKFKVYFFAGNFLISPGNSLISTGFGIYPTQPAFSAFFLSPFIQTILPRSLPFRHPCLFNPFNISQQEYVRLEEKNRSFIKGHKYTLDIKMQILPTRFHNDPKDLTMHGRQYFHGKL